VRGRIPMGGEVMTGSPLSAAVRRAAES
jgi:hypothetical protein